MTQQKKPLILQTCEWLASKLPGITIKLPNPNDPEKKKVPYLSRFYFFWKDRKWFNVFLHHFHSSDLEVDENGLGILHSHPFTGSFSLVLVVGYSEEKLMKDGSIQRRQIRPWTFNIITKNNFHRVDLNKGEAWTLFFTGPRTKNGDWFFWNRSSGELKHWSKSPNAIP